MAYTGLRAGEVAGLNVADLDLLRRLVYVRRTRRKVTGGWEVHTPKNGKERPVGLPLWLATDLRQYLAAPPSLRRPSGTALARPDQRRAGPLRRGQGRHHLRRALERDAFYKRQFKPALRAADLPATVRLHDLRHTAGSLMLRAGIDPYRVADYLGRSLTVLLKICAHVLEADRDADMERLARPTRRGAP